MRDRLVAYTNKRPQFIPIKQDESMSYSLSQVFQCMWWPSPSDGGAYEDDEIITGGC